MTLLTLVLLVLVVAVVLSLLNTYVPMDRPVRVTVNAVVIVLLLVALLNALGLLGHPIVVR